MTWIRFVLMLYFFIVAHKAACQGLLEDYEDMVEVLLLLEKFLIYLPNTLNMQDSSPNQTAVNSYQNIKH